MSRSFGIATCVKVACVQCASLASRYPLPGDAQQSLAVSARGAGLPASSAINLVEQHRLDEERRRGGKQSAAQLCSRPNPDNTPITHRFFVPDSRSECQNSAREPAESDCVSAPAAATRWRSAAPSWRARAAAVETDDVGGWRPSFGGSRPRFRCEVAHPFAMGGDHKLFDAVAYCHASIVDAGSAQNNHNSPAR